MLKKMLVPTTIAMSLTLAGCSSGDVSQLQAEVDALKKEIAELKTQIGGSAPSAPTNDSNASNAANDSYGLGEEIVSNGVTFTITEGKRMSELSENLKANEGKEFLIYYVHITNTSNEDYEFRQSDYSIVLGNGEIEDNYLLIDTANQYDDLGNGELASGGTKSGFVAFEIPQNDQPLEMRYEKRTFSESTAFKVKLQ
ncbi:DUF4352 domain-containing protein [Marinicrinis lubricantis]|uniref:DUF4352 domain-containing protein n=1 Tax=Marinicrinis lubricantis TaxID=2086470 RepID=A0ABW1INE8_9BACL